MITKSFVCFHCLKNQTETLHQIIFVNIMLSFSFYVLTFTFINVTYDKFIFEGTKLQQLKEFEQKKNITITCKANFAVSFCTFVSPDGKTYKYDVVKSKLENGVGRNSEVRFENNQIKEYLAQLFW